jgi:N-acetyl-gamma-glutamyl-phosphate reductase
MTQTAVKAAILGATGYTGEELARLLARHPQAALVSLTSHSHVGKAYSDVYPHMRGIVDQICEEEDIEGLAERADVIFIALPHGHAASKVNARLLERVKVIDLGADYRLKEQSAYEHWYGVAHASPELLPKAVYGLPEWHREAVRNARLLANPGCYPTCSSLSLAPLLKAGLIEPDSIIIDAKSGVTGAGRAVKQDLHYVECSESIKAYGLVTHRHTPEIEQSLGSISGQAVSLTFTPHLVPMSRGILVTAYARLTRNVGEAELREVYLDTYRSEPFVRLCPAGAVPETRWVKGSNFCDIGFRVDERNQRVIVVGAIDNLLKGASGQAVQNMNLMFGLEETLGLLDAPMFPG